MAWGPQPQQIGNLALVRGGAAGRQLVGVLRFGDTSWTVPRTSKYTFYVYAPGANQRGGDFVLATRSLSKDTVLTCTVGGGSVYANNSGVAAKPPSGNTILNGGGLSIVAGTAGAASSGGDFISVGTALRSGGDGTLYGPFSPSRELIIDPATSTYSYGQHPGGPTARQNDYLAAAGGNGEIRIVDETP